MENTKYRILLVEDNELDQIAFKRLIENNSLPYDCVMAGSVSEAQRALSSEQFDIVISDYLLGDGTAFDVLKMVKDTPTILVTGAGDEETAIKAWKAGAYDYLIKDLDQNYLKTVPITIENAVSHKKMEKKLQLLCGAIMSTEDSVYITDMDDNIIFVNKAFCVTYGYNEGEIIGRKSNILWIGKQQSTNTRSVFQTRGVGSSWEVGFYHTRKNGSIFPVSLSRAMIKGSNGNEVAIVGIAHDISERILIEDELRTSNLKLEKLNRQKSRLAIVVSNEQKKLLDERNIDGIKRITNDFLDISMIDAGTMDIKIDRINFGEVVSQIIEELTPFAAQKDIELKSSVPDCELAINADRDRIAQALGNLINRTIISTPANGHINMEIKDTGNGFATKIYNDSEAIDGNEIQEIFNRSEWIEKLYAQQVEDSASASSGKTDEEAHVPAVESLLTGLELLIAKELVEMHGGCMWAESKDANQGNSLCFTLPKSGVRQQVPLGAVRSEQNYLDTL